MKIFDFIAVIIIGSIALSVFFLFFSSIIIFLFGILCCAIFLWICGVPLQVKKDDVVIGHFKRTKFIPKRDE